MRELLVQMIPCDACGEGPKDYRINGVGSDTAEWYVCGDCIDRLFHEE